MELTTDHPLAAPGSSSSSAASPTRGGGAATAAAAAAAASPAPQRRSLSPTSIDEELFGPTAPSLPRQSSVAAAATAAAAAPPASAAAAAAGSPGSPASPGPGGPPPPRVLSSGSSANPSDQGSSSFVVVPPGGGSAAAAAASAASASSTEKPAHGPPAYARFTVEKPISGAETLRPITYFPIRVEPLLPPDAGDGAFVFQPHPVAPHHRGVPPLAGLKRNRWETGVAITVERRYSEIIEFRDFLVMCFPYLVIPPLPPKSQIDSLNTYLQSESHLRAQQRSIARFLRDLSRIPEAMLLCDATPNFFQKPRETFLPYFDSLRGVISRLSAANASLEEHRPPKRAYGPKGAGDSGSVVAHAAAVAAETTRAAVKNVVSLLSSWYASASAASPAAHAAAQSSLHAEIQARFEANADARRLAELEERFFEKKAALFASADAYMKFISAYDEQLQALRDVADGFSGLAANLSESAKLAPLGAAAEACGHFALTISDAHGAEPDKNYVNFYELLLYEVAYLDAAEDALQFARCLLRRACEVEVDRKGRGDVASDTTLIYVRAVIERLDREARVLFVRDHNRRLKRAIVWHARQPVDYLASENAATTKTEFLRMINAPGYSSMPPVEP